MTISKRDFSRYQEIRHTVFGSEQVYGPAYTITLALAGPPVGLPALSSRFGTGTATAIAEVAPNRKRDTKTIEVFWIKVSSSFGK